MILDALLELPYSNPSYYSADYITSAKADQLISSSQCSLDNQACCPAAEAPCATDRYCCPDPDKMVYYIFPVEMSYTILDNYAPANTQVDECAFIEYWVDQFYKFDIIDINKWMIYLAYDTELMCHFPGERKSYHQGPPSSSTLLGYNFDTNETVYYASIRSWFDAGRQGTGFTTFVSTYVFSGVGNIGATISQSILDDKNVGRSILGYDIIPYSSFNEKNTLLSKLLFDQSSESFDYFMIDESKVQPGNYNKDSIVSDLARMIYSTPTDSDSDITSKETEIAASFKVEMFTSTYGVDYEYITYNFEGDKKYLFFSDISLYEYRRDGSFNIRNVNKVGFTGSSAVLEGDLRETIDDAIGHVIGVTITGGVIIILIGIIVGILASRIFANTLVDPFINLCIKMKIAQNAQQKMRRVQKQETMHLSQALMVISSKTDTKTKSEFQKLYEKIENVLKVFEMKNFHLLEGGNPSYYKSAKVRYQQILQIYIKAEDELPSTKDTHLSLQQLMETCKNVSFTFSFSACALQEDPKKVIQQHWMPLLRDGAI